MTDFDEFVEGGKHKARVFFKPSNLEFAKGIYLLNMTFKQDIILEEIVSKLLHEPVCEALFHAISPYATLQAEESLAFLAGYRPNNILVNYTDYVNLGIDATDLPPLDMEVTYLSTSEEEQLCLYDVKCHDTIEEFADFKTSTNGTFSTAIRDQGIYDARVEYECGRARGFNFSAWDGANWGDPPQLVGMLCDGDGNWVYDFPAKINGTGLDDMSLPPCTCKLVRSIEVINDIELGTHCVDPNVTGNAGTQIVLSTSHDPYGEYSFGSHVNYECANGRKFEEDFSLTTQHGLCKEGNIWDYSNLTRCIESEAVHNISD